MTESPGDIDLIQRDVDHLYQSVSFEPGGHPSIENLRDLLIPEAHLINNNEQAPGRELPERYLKQ